MSKTESHGKFLARTIELKRYASEYTKTTWYCDFCHHDEPTWMKMSMHLLDEHRGKIRLGELEKDITEREIE